MEFITKSAEESQELGRKIGSSLKGGEILALRGELGAGKTTFIQGLAHGLSIESTLTSPTFIIMRSYKLPEKVGRIAKTLYHVDLYRIEENVEKEIQNLGIYDLWGKENAIFVIEWADRITDLPQNTKKISLEVLDEGTRKISL